MSKTKELYELGGYSAMDPVMFVSSEYGSTLYIGEISSTSSAEQFDMTRPNRRDKAFRIMVTMIGALQEKVWAMEQAELEAKTPPTRQPYREWSYFKILNDAGDLSGPHKTNDKSVAFGEDCIDQIETSPPHQLLTAEPQEPKKLSEYEPDGMHRNKAHTTSRRPE